ncbi:MAG: hypothetical protein AAGF24_05120 [Cyanobacteria bacterium P01_H01_bin.121]
MPTDVATDKRRITAYVDPPLEEDIKKLAAIDKRSVSNLIEILLQQAVDQAKAEGKI